MTTQRLGRRRTLVLTFAAGAGLSLLAVRLHGKSGSATLPSDPTEATDGASSRGGADDLESLRRRIARMEKTEQARGEGAGHELTKSVDEAAKAAYQNAL